MNPNFYADRFDIVYIFSPTLHNDKLNRHYLKSEKFITFDTYNDAVLQEILDSQLSLMEGEGEAPRIAILFDDCSK